MAPVIHCHICFLAHLVIFFFLKLPIVTFVHCYTKYREIDHLISVLLIGTGKTRTLTAAIEQIVKSTDKNVLVCAQTNAACDEIIERLLPILNNEEMFRMYARSFDAHKLKAEIEPYSNWVAFKDSEFCYPSMTFILKFRVVVCTLCTAGVLSRSGIAPSHFDYIIIDECASAHETMSLIAIAGMTRLKLN